MKHTTVFVIVIVICFFCAVPLPSFTQQRVKQLQDAPGSPAKPTSERRSFRSGSLVGEIQNSSAERRI